MSSTAPNHQASHDKVPSTLSLILDTHRAQKQGAAAIAQRQRTRLAEIVRHARSYSPYYRELYRDLPELLDNLALLPVTSKNHLMPHFDDWVTDPDVTLKMAQAFVENPALIGKRFLGKYTLATTSGTTGHRGIFLLDDGSMAVTNALGLRMLRSWLTIGDVLRIIAGGARLTMINAMGGHFASAVVATSLQKRGSKRFQVLPVDMPMSEMVSALNRFRPAVIASYASMAALLASEQEAGRLRIKPVLTVLSAERLAEGEYNRIAKAFRATVRDSYAATECPFLSYRCEHGWLHVNADWVLLEPVDAAYQPVLPGTQSHTVLVSNLANRVQPILRYDLGDSVVQCPHPCPCGNTLPAIRVQGRSADVLTFPAENGEKITVAPLQFVTLVDRIQGIERIQIVQTTPTSLRVRLYYTAGADSDRVWREVESGLRRLLSERKLSHITLEHAKELPQQSAGGKYREVIPLP